MKKRIGIAVSVLCCMLAVLGLTPSWALEEVRSGVFRIDVKSFDELLTLGDRTDLSVLVLDDSRTKSVSDVHTVALREWVESGGVLWVAGDGLDSSLAQTVAPFRIESFNYVRSASGKRGGELIVKGSSPRMVIADNSFTKDVNQLYLFARSKFDGTARAEPLVQMGDTQGNSGWVLTAVSVGRGFMLLDGTARKERRLFGRLKGFDSDHPNSLKQESGWNSYDWTRLQDNVRDHARSLSE